MAEAELVFRTGETVKISGIYEVDHDPAHTQRHEVTCVEGKKFPPCRTCQHPLFKVVHAAEHIEKNVHLIRKSPSDKIGDTFR
jgi:hypothetical protein